MPDSPLAWLIFTGTCVVIVVACAVEWMDRKREGERGFPVKRKE